MIECLINGKSEALDLTSEQLQEDQVMGVFRCLKDITNTFKISCRLL